jgi:hypothetical protein
MVAIMATIFFYWVIKISIINSFNPREEIQVCALIQLKFNQC